MTSTSIYRVLVFGLNYQGIFLSFLLAKNGHDVVAVDLEEKKISLLSRGLCDGRVDKMKDLYLLYGDKVQYKEQLEENEKSFDVYIFIEKDQDKLFYFIEKNHEKIKRKALLFLMSDYPFSTHKMIQDYFQKIGKEVLLVSSPLLEEKKSIYENVFFPDYLLLGCERDETYLNAYLFLLTCYPDTQMIYTNANTAEMAPFLLSEYKEHMKSFFEMQIPLLKECQVNWDHMQMIFPHFSFLEGKKRREPFLPLAYLKSQKEMEEKYYAFLENLVLDVCKEREKIVFLGVSYQEDTSFAETFIYPLLLRLLKQKKNVWLYDEKYLSWAREQNDEKKGLHYGESLQDALKQAHFVFIYSETYKIESIKAPYVVDLIHFQLKGFTS